MSMPPDVADERDLQYVSEVRLAGSSETKQYHDPIFVLRAQDTLAPSVIEIWATRLENTEHELHRKSGIAESAFQPSWKVREARAIAHEMRAWQERNTKKVPD